jgi:hypothetical protein
MNNYTREDLIKICEMAIVSENKWRNRDSASSQRKIGEIWALLKAGCDFKILTDKNNYSCTDDQIIWIEIVYDGFSTFEGMGKEKDVFYMPTREGLLAVNGGDWY